MRRGRNANQSVICLCRNSGAIDPTAPKLEANFSTADKTQAGSGPRAMGFLSLRLVTTSGSRSLAPYISLRASLSNHNCKGLHAPTCLHCEGYSIRREPPPVQILSLRPLQNPWPQYFTLPSRRQLRRPSVRRGIIFSSVVCAAAIFRSWCGANRKAPVSITQRFPAGAPHSGQGIAEICFLVGSGDVTRC